MSTDAEIAPATERLEMVLGQLAELDPGEAGFIVQRLLEQIDEERRNAPSASRAQTARQIVRARDWDCDSGRPGGG